MPLDANDLKQIRQEIARATADLPQYLRVDGGRKFAGKLFDFGSAESKGVFFEQLTTAQRDSLTNVKKGRVIFNLSTNKLNVFTGLAWEAITST